MVVSGIDTGETLERWQFNVSIEDDDCGAQISLNDENQKTSSNIPKQNYSNGDKFGKKRQSKTVKEVHDEIQAIIRQITASVSASGAHSFHLVRKKGRYSSNFSSSSLVAVQVTFLPLLNEPCSFDLLIYTNKNAVVPQKWLDSDPRYIMNSQEVKLRSFTTSVCFVDCENVIFHANFLFSFFLAKICHESCFLFQFHQVDSMVTYKEADEWEL